MESSYLGAYWGSRRESAAECGERLALCLQAIGKVDPVLSSWFLRGASKAAARTPVGTDPNNLAALLERGRNRRDSDAGSIDELGYSAGMWNRAQPTVGLSAHVGSYSDNRGILNSVVLNITGPADRLYLEDTATAVLDAVVAAWEPNWATWATHEWREIQSVPSREPVVGWLTYLSSATLPLGGVSARHLGRGVLIQTAPEIESVSETSILAARDQLRTAALLHPIP